jgi:hypothetical protein
MPFVVEFILKAVLSYSIGCLVKWIGQDAAVQHVLSVLSVYTPLPVDPTPKQQQDPQSNE